MKYVWLLKLLCLIIIFSTFFTTMRCCEKDLLSLHKEKLARQERYLEDLYDYDIIVTQHLQHMGMNYENMLDMDTLCRRQLLYKNLRIWAAFSNVKKYDDLINAQERAIRDTERSIKSLQFNLALEKYRQELTNNP